MNASGWGGLIRFVVGARPGKLAAVAVVVVVVDVVAVVKDVVTDVILPQNNTRQSQFLFFKKNT